MPKKEQQHNPLIETPSGKTKFLFFFSTSQIRNNKTHLGLVPSTHPKQELNPSRNRNISKVETAKSQKKTNDFDNFSFYKKKTHQTQLTAKEKNIK